MLHIHLSNRPEALSAALAALMRTDPLPLLETEQVIGPSTAVSRWLGFGLADALGVAARIAFPFAAAFVWQLFGRVLPEVAVANPFERAAMQWRLMRLLGRSDAPPVRRYLAEDDGTKCHELAARLAALFERYLVERPDWIVAWNRGKRIGLGPDEGWQMDLWRAFADELSGVAAEHPREQFLQRLRESPEARSRLPRRISLFAIDAMPELYWEVFAGLAEWIDLHVFVLAPSREFWGDIERKRERLQIELEHPEQAALYATGHPLLASLGRARQHAVVRLADASARCPTDEHAYFAPPPSTLLGALQRDMLDLAESTAGEADATLQVHACHGPLREAEVLHDRLLDLFERMPDLRPADILILTPDIETYAPAVEAVLTHAPHARRIPCAVADRSPAAAPLWRALQRLCSVAAGEFDAESVMALLEEPPLRCAFDIAEGEIPLLRDWVADAGIRWAEDGRARRRRNLPAEDAHSWRAGLRRLLLGVAMPDRPERLCADTLPVAGIEGARAELLGRFIDFVEALFALGGKVGADRTAPAWAEILAAAMTDFLAPSEAEEPSMQRLRDALASLAVLARDAGCETPLPLAVMLREVEALLAERSPSQAFAGGAATIAALQPGRPLPARVICLVGMNDGAWPRPSAVPGFDLIARYPRPGDRNRRGEERYAFLETVLCARDVLLITYSGRDARSNVVQPPAAPLAELLDTLAAMTGKPPDEFIVQHPLQPFGAAYFDGRDPRLFSYDDVRSPTAAGQASRAASPFMAPSEPRDLPDHGDGAALDGAALDGAQLLRFFAQPTQTFLRDRLAIHLEASEELLETHEPFVPDPLNAYRLRENFFSGMRQGVPDEETTRLIDARGWLPHGIVGALSAAAARDEAAVIWQMARQWAEAPGRPVCDVDYFDGVTRLSGQLDGLTERGLWRVRHGRTRAVDRLRLWLEHLLLNVSAPVGVPCRSVLVAQDGVTQFAPEARAGELLAGLLALYRRGRAAPLPFYPETAWAWLEGRADWRGKWEGNAYQGIPGERDDPYVKLALRDCRDDPLGDAFRQLAQRIFGPMRDALKVGDG